MRYILLFFAALVLSSAANAQLSISVNFNVDRQPIWGPTGYDHVDFYYLPDIDCYYNVPNHRFYYEERGRWRYSSSLPRRYRSYDLYNSYKVVINDPEPYRHADTYRSQYASFKGQHDQQSIRDSRDSKYYVNPKHPEHKNWVKQHKNDNKSNNGRGNDRNNDRNHSNDRGGK